ncbi:hypothetical protein [Sphingobium fuliginis]|uniref:Uncharacterized protein n=1 Tax=Sphingobium fuliginis (strain ATCC 27551) TaxID=336203 RepID=A0ABQ1EZG5_SPHSA|nr:hypothetical protein [Sphingobium fuliginis]RYL97619.1 hypothetical protein EWH10_13825 [Sphingobium fuliginis]GFZ94195.1 hypothetical protein GCM10019071_25600 [Sphingobium fuliginis]
MNDENNLSGLNHGFADADQSDNIRLELIKENRVAVEAKITAIKAESLSLEAKASTGNISPAELDRHREDILRARKRLEKNLSLLELYISRLEQVEN